MENPYKAKLEGPFKRSPLQSLCRNAGVLLFLALPFSGLPFLEIPAAHAQTVEGDLPSEWRRPAPLPLPTSSRLNLRIALGRDLFADARLSKEGDLSCQSCHQPGNSWSDHQSRAVGRFGAVLPRRTPSLLDVRYETLLFRDGRAISLEDQALRPFFHPLELALGGKGLLIVLGRDQDYRQRFRNAFPGRGLSLQTVAHAIADYERTLIRQLNAVDHYLDGHLNALSPEALSGAKLFMGKAKCATCHKGWRFGGSGFAINGVISSDKGRALDVPGWPGPGGQFKIPSLRGVSSRPPYMHAGQKSSLLQVMDHYLSPRAPYRITLTPPETEHLIAFLKVL